MSAVPIARPIAGPIAGPIVASETGALGEARALLRRGRLRHARDRLLALARQPATADRPAVLALLVECHLAQGDLAAALALDDELAAQDRAEARHARAELAAARHEDELAVDRFLAVAHADGADADGLAPPWRAGAALAMVRVGRRREAHDLALTHDAAARAHGGAADVALALRVLATTDPDGRRVPHLRQALLLLDGLEPGRLRAQVETDLAGMLLLGGDRAGALVLLRAAESYAAREDLWPLHHRVGRLLERMDERPRRLEAEALAVLTAAEQRVAVLALEGLTNRQIAARLAVSVKAVEGHLSRVYRKLDVDSRSALLTSFLSRR